MGAPRDLREFIARLERRGWVKRIKDEVDPRLEISAMAELVMKSRGPALVFERPRGYRVPVAINLFGSPRRMAMALGVEELEELGRRLEALLELELPRGGLVSRLAAALPRLKDLRAFAPREVKRAPCQEVVLEGPQASLKLLPVLTCWPQDAGAFITLPQVITADPETGRQNMGMYRMQVFDEHTTGMHWHLHKDAASHYRKAKAMGKRLEVCVALGGPPALTYAATAPLPPGVDEMGFAGLITSEPIRVVKAVSCDLLVPAEAEVVLEGYVDPAEPWRTEGPFGDHTGYYSPPEPYPVFHITHITHRKDFIYPATVVGIPPMEDYYLGLATQRLMLPLIRMVLPEVVDYHMPAEGVFHNLVVVAIKKTYPGQPYKVMHALWGMGQMMFAKVIVVVDEWVNVRNMSEVWWQVLANIDPARDVLITRGPADALDHAAATACLHGKLGIDATAKTPAEGHHRPWPKVVRMDPKLRAQALARLKQWGILG